MTRAHTLCALAIAACIAVPPAVQAQSAIQAGVLSCRGAETASYFVGSTRPIDCVFQSNSGRHYAYHGVVQRVGVDVGFTQQSMLSWAVFAPSRRVGPGALAGNYGGLSAGAAVGVGANAMALVGGSQNAFSLQPLSLEGQTGLNVALAIANLELAPGLVPAGPRRIGHHHHRSQA